MCFVFLLLTECDSCTHTLLVDLEKKAADLVWLKQQLQSSGYDPVSPPSLNSLEANISEAKVPIHGGGDVFFRVIKLPFGTFAMKDLMKISRFQIIRQHFSKFKVLLSNVS